MNAAADPIPVPKLKTAEFERFQELIHRETGIHLRGGKVEMLSARLGRRLRALGLSSFSEYYNLLTQDDPEHQELRNLVNTVTTNKTSFFREAHHFEYLTACLKQQASRNKQRFRLWSTACSTGEEPYSVAITVHEAFGNQLPAKDVRILATDLDTEVLAKARAGVYEESHLGPVSPEWRKRYFLRGKGSDRGYVKAKPKLQELISFQQLNLIAPAWPVKGPFDFIFCRNVMIYFDAPTQHRLVERLIALLRPDGNLFMGHSENLQWAREQLRPVGHSIYKLRSDRHS